MEELTSYNRPLTRDARKDLKEYGIEAEHSVNQHGRWTVVEVKELPPKELLDKHELRHKVNPEYVFETDMGDQVLIYESEVIVDGVETTMPPEEAVEHARKEGWEQVSA